MKHIHIIFFIILLTVTWTTFPTTAQNSVKITYKELSIKSDSAHADLTIDLTGVKLRNRSFVMITPVIQKNNMSLDMPFVMINGKNRHKAYLRLVSLRRPPSGMGMVINAAPKVTPRIYHYAVSAPLEPWMTDAGLSIREEKCHCNGKPVPVSYEQKTDSTKQYEPQFVVAYMTPIPEQVKFRSELGKAYLDFVVDKYDINPNFKNNDAELSKMGELILKVKNESGATITGIIIDGYASIEAPYYYNLELSKNRSLAFKDYLCTTYNLKEDLFTVNWHGEDWATLEKLLVESNLAYKEPVLQIIRTTDIFDGREKQLMVLQGGKPYLDMLDNLFPQLRRAEYEIQYTVIPFSIEEGKKKLESNPKLLSLNEMFLIAQTYPEGSEDYQRVFDIAVATYPDNDIANINAAATALENGDDTTAQKFLDRVMNRNAAFENNMGVLVALQGNYEKATGHFRKAVDGGVDEATKNLDEIEKLKKMNHE